MANSTRFPRVPSNAPPEMQDWARAVEALFNEILTRLAAQERRR